MKIGFPFYDGPGGARTWVKTFSRYCVLKGYNVSYGVDPTVDVFCSVANLSSVEDLKLMKDNQVKILQRLGAAYLPYQYDDAVLTRCNNNLKEIISYADQIVYQSRFSKEVIFNYVYEGYEPPGAIIYNSTNSDVFRKMSKIDTQLFRESRPNRSKKIILAMAFWGEPKAANESLRLLHKIIKMYEHREDVEFWVLGKAYKKDIEFFKDNPLKNITRFNLSDPIPHDEVPQYLNIADVFLHLKVHEGCSNMVIEALNTGTPIVGLNSGSLPELVGSAGNLVDCEDSIYSFPKVKDIHDFVGYIDDELRNPRKYERLAMKRANLFKYKKTYDQYIQLFEELNR